MPIDLNILKQYSNEFENVWTTVSGKAREISLSELKFGLANVCSLNRRHRAVEDVISKYALDILFMTETFVTPDTPVDLVSTYTPNNFKGIHSEHNNAAGRQAKSGGGIATYYRDGLPVQKEQLPAYTRRDLFDVQGIRVGEGSDQHIFLLTYRRPRRLDKDKKAFKRGMDKILKEYEYHANVTLLGDFNLPGRKKGTVHKSLNEYLEKHQLLQQVTFPTHRQDNLIDIIAARKPSQFSNIAPAEFISDHVLITGVVNVSTSS